MNPHFRKFLFFVSFPLISILITNCGDSAGQECGYCVPSSGAGEDIEISAGQSTSLICEMRLEPEDDQVCKDEKESILYQWEQVNGPEADLQGADQRQALFTPVQPGSYEFRCKAVYPVTEVNCEVRESAWDSVSVTVQ